MVTTIAASDSSTINPHGIDHDGTGEPADAQSGIRMDAPSSGADVLAVNSIVDCSTLENVGSIGLTHCG
ncbi:hypothetical protein [Nocardia australiensis]|uniref:hypothetical protein n=1 Tax=Nocardia australiensis TaxID=2887191 RepID=UPI001D13FAD3|nr:hypothetical protein [Nocardia australiensis]